jgi:putative transposase
VTYFKLMNAECATTSIARMARLLPVSRPGYYAWKNAGEQTSPAEQLREDRKAKVLHFHEKSDGTYGSPRVTADLREIGDTITRKTVAKLMAEAGIAGISPRTFKVRTTDVDRNALFPDDLVEQNFNRGETDLVWSSDITYLHCGEGDMFLCAVKDEHSKRILGWSLDDHMRSELVADALKKAAMTRSYICNGTIFHSDRGRQYTSKTIVDLAEELGLRRSMGDTGICWDNAGAESLWSTFKHEYYYRHTFATKAELLAAVECWVHRYNHDRRHSALDQTSPVNYEVASVAANKAA